MSTSTVTVIGLGPMGRAMARTLLAAGHDVVVWNRTSSRADSLVAAGARRAASPVAAVAAGDLVILSLTDYQAMHDVLAGATGSLTGRTLVNLSSDTPDRTREAASWAASHGASFLAGGVMVPAPMVGSDRSYLYVSGDAVTFESHRGTLAHLGDPRFLGDDPGRAQAMYQAQLGVFLASLSGLAQGVALVGEAGIPAATFVPEVMPLLRGIPDIVAGDGPAALGARIDDGDHPGELSTSIMMGATADHIVGASTAAGIDTALPLAVQSHYRRVIDDGHGTDNWTRIVEGLRAPRAQSAPGTEPGGRKSTSCNAD